VGAGHLKAAASAGFFARRWRGEVPLATLFWRDMIAIGSLLNLGASFFALMLAAQGAPTGWAVAMHFAPLPYNLFLFAALWRRSDRSAAMSLGAGLWLAAATLF